MPFLVSPGVNVSEIDLTTIVPVLGVSEGGWAGTFQWGPVDEVKVINDEIELVRWYWQPDNNTFTSFFTAANFLSYTNNLRVVRAANTKSKNAVSDPSDGFVESVSITEEEARIPDGVYALTFTGGSPDYQATGNVIINDGVIDTVALANTGNGYTSAPTATFLSGVTNSTLTVSVDSGNNKNVLSVNVSVNDVSIVDGSYYLTFSNTSFAGTGSNVTANAIATVESGIVTDTTIINDGSNYLTAPAVTLKVAGGNVTTTAQFTAAMIDRGNPHIKNETVYNERWSSGDSRYAGQWAAKYPGSMGNSIKVSMFSSSNTAAFEAWDYFGYFDQITGTSEYVSGKDGANDEIHIIVTDSEGLWTGTKGSVLERFGNLSKAPDATTFDGSSNYYKTVVNDRSNYIWWMAHPENAALVNNNSGYDDWGTPAAGADYAFIDTDGVIDSSLTGGTYANPTLGDKIRAYDLFRNVDEVDVALLMAGDHGATIATYLINNIAETRKDCVVLVSPRRTDVVDNIGDEAEDCVIFRNQLPSSSYGILDCNWKYQFDKYNNVYRWVPLSGDIAGLCARTDNQRDPWFSPAGFNRGQIKNVVKFAWNPDQSDRDTLYKNGINPVLRFPGEGPILYGDKTLQAKPSAFDRINVRRLFIVLEKAIARAAKYSLFEFNDAFTRAQFVALVEPFLRDVQGRRGIYDFRVVCDETNNTPEVIDRNEFIGDIYIKPARSINFIQLNFIAVRTGVAFEEVVGKF